MKDISPKFLRGFLEYLNGDINSHTNGKLSQETVYTYFTVFAILLNKAVRTGIIAKNPFHKLGKDEKPQRRTKRAGITKHVTFHMSRHTCATMLLYYGADLYTVSKILGHTSIKTTQIYAKVVDDTKVRAVNRDLGSFVSIS